MEDKIIVFEREDVESDWLDNNDGASLCPPGLNAYVDIPRDIHKFEAVFTVERPAGNDYFEMTKQHGRRANFVTEFGIDWTSSARSILHNAWNRGYRFCSVRY